MPRKHAPPPGAGKKSTAVKVVVPRLSVVRPPARDFDVGALRLQNKQLSARLAASITAGTLATTIQGASTLTLTVSDWSHGLLRSEILRTGPTLTFDGINFTLVKIASADDATLTLTFEELAVNLLRQYSSPKKANRANTTRAQFVRSMVQEVKEAVIPFECPEVNVRQPILAAAGVTGGGGGAPVDQPAGSPGANVGGWITTGGTEYTDCTCAYGDCCDGGLYYAELGEAGANAGFGGLLGKALGRTGPLAAHTRLEVQYGGKSAFATKLDVGSGQLGDRHYTIDLHQKLSQALGFPGKADVRVRLA